MVISWTKQTQPKNVDARDRNRKLSSCFYDYCLRAVCEFFLVMWLIRFSFVSFLFFFSCQYHPSIVVWCAGISRIHDRPLLPRCRRGSGEIVEERPAAHQWPRELHRFPHATPRGARYDLSLLSCVTAINQHPPPAVPPAGIFMIAIYFATTFFFTKIWTFFFNRPWW